MENKKLIIDNSKAESQYSKNHNKYLPTPAVDELNLDSKNILRKHFHGYSDEQFEEEINRFPLNECLIAMNDTTHHNHASFVALVEGEIKNVKQAIDNAKGMFTSNNKIRLGTLTELLTKIK